MRLRKITPFKCWTQKNWDDYCKRGVYFTRQPHYELAKSSDLRNFVHGAENSGWKMVSKVTNHNGVCQTLSENISWIQQTSWIFTLPGSAAMIRVSYVEQDDGRNTVSTKAEHLELKSNCTAYVSVDCDDEMYFISKSKFTGWKLGMGHCSEGHVDVELVCANSRKSMDKLFTSKFWSDASITLLQSVKKGKLSRISSSWSGVHVLPGQQTIHHEISSGEFELEFFRKLAASGIARYVNSFHMSPFGYFKPKTANKIYPPCEMVALVKGTRDVVNDTSGSKVLHDCREHASHCVIFDKFNGELAVLPASENAIGALPWHSVFDMNDRFRDSMTDRRS